MSRIITEMILRIKKNNIYVMNKLEQRSKMKKIIILITLKSGRFIVEGREEMSQSCTHCLAKSNA